MGATNQARITESEDALPRAFGRYVLFDHIGRGGMADIYLARMRNALGGHRLCVIKEVLPRFSDDSSFSQMLTAEAKLAAQLNHANVVQVFDLGRENGRLFLAMDYVEGFDLNEMLRRLSQQRIGLPSEFAFAIVIETLRALDYAHRRRDENGERIGLVHRDVSPSNVLISFEGEVKLCDFGIARAMMRDEGPEENAVGRSRLAGKAAYMAPEHARGEDIDARADVFAAGILLWELASGRRLYKGDDLLALARAAEIPPLEDRGIPGHAALQAIVARALAPEPRDRFQTAGEFLQALETFAIGHRLAASPLRFGAFLTDHFAEDILVMRRERERSADQIDADADPASFGPSSAPPPADDAAAVFVPRAPAVPKEALRLAGADLGPDSDEWSGDTVSTETSVEDPVDGPDTTPPSSLDIDVSSSELHDALPVAPLAAAGFELPAAPSAPARVSPWPAPFSLRWYLLLAMASALVFAASFFAMR